MPFHLKLHKILEQAARLDDAELAELDARLHELIARREAEAREPYPVKEGREVAEERKAGTWTLRLEFVRCGKDNCHCARDRGHGPYWYAYSRSRGRVVSEYIGKSLSKFTKG